MPWSKITLPPTPDEAETKTASPLEEYKASLNKQPRAGFKPDAKGDRGAFGFDKAGE